MKKIFTLVIFVLFGFFIYLNRTSTQEKKNEAQASTTANYASTLPDFSLKDPLDNLHTKSALNQEGIVLVVTAPIFTNETAQRNWSESLENTKGSSKAKLVFLEDMSPSYFKTTALNEMKKEYSAQGKTILLIDPQGELRQKLGVAEKETVVLAYDKNGKLLKAVEGSPSIEKARSLWKQVGP